MAKKKAKRRSVASKRSSRKSTARTGDDELGEGTNRSPNTVTVNVPGLGIPTYSRPFLVEYFPTRDQLEAELRVRHEELERQRKKITTVMRPYRKKWLNSKDVVGVNVAFRTKFGMTVSPIQYVIQVDVRKKMPMPELETRVAQQKKGRSKAKASGYTIFPPHVRHINRQGKPISDREYPVKVRELDLILSPSLEPVPSPDLSRDPPPVKGGMAIANETSSDKWGTLGICIPHEDSDGEILLAVSNRHVTGPHNSDVIQVFSSLDPSGIENDIVKVKRSSISVVDASTGMPTNSTRPFEEGVSLLEYNHRFQFASNRKLPSKMMNKKILKVGAKTGIRRGHISNNAMDFIVEDTSADEYTNVIECSTDSNHQITEGGDSGSVLIYEHEDNQSTPPKLVPVVIGLNFAMSKDQKHSYAFPMGKVLSTLGIEVPRNIRINLNRLL